MLTSKICIATKSDKERFRCIKAVIFPLHTQFLSSVSSAGVRYKVTVFAYVRSEGGSDDSTGHNIEVHKGAGSADEDYLTRIINLAWWS